jgi:hypothetical protein
MQTVTNCPNLKMQNFVLFSAKSSNIKCFDGGPGMKKRTNFNENKNRKKEWMSFSRFNDVITTLGRCYKLFTVVIFKKNITIVIF